MRFSFLSVKKIFRHALSTFHITVAIIMSKVKSTEKGIFIPHELIDLPAGTEFSIRKGKYHIMLEPEGLTNKTAGLVRIGKIDIDEEIGRMIESKVVG